MACNAGSPLRSISRPHRGIDGRRLHRGIDGRFAQETEMAAGGNPHPCKNFSTSRLTSRNNPERAS
jgi:hypothetical protein